MSGIIALKYVSAVDIAKVFPSFTYDYIKTNPKEFQDILYQFGMNINYMYEIQEDKQHKSIEGKLVQADRYVGQERTDKEWLDSGWASREAKDKSSGSKLLNDLYRMKGLS